MSVVERIAARALTDEWHAATAQRDRTAMLNLLKRVAMPDAALVVERILADPAAYGL